ncbi:MAG: RNA-binding cell elongation regulator Jag/EloR [Armatimonadota bacterium]
MTSIEMTGKNIEEATELALEQLGATEDDVYVEILDEGTKGFLGLGQTPAKVRVTLKEAAVQAPAESEEEPYVSEEPQVSTEKAEAPAARPVYEREAMTEDMMQAAAEKSVEVLQTILDGIGSGGKAEIKNVSPDAIYLNIVDGDAGVLIGKHGQTINAMQYLTGVITNRQIHNRVRVLVDAEDYRTRREESLKSQALYLAEKVRESKQEAVLDSLDANERRIIHTTLADDPYVYTYSEGEEPDRHVVISPKK